jgi:hypothetical protein
MAEPDLSKKSLRALIVALLDGRAGHLKDPPSSETVGVTAILAELRRRTGQDLGADPHAWSDWYLSTYPLDRLQLQFAEVRRRIRDIERRVLRGRGR